MYFQIQPPASGQLNVVWWSQLTAKQPDQQCNHSQNTNHQGDSYPCPLLVAWLLLHVLGIWSLQKCFLNLIVLHTEIVGEDKVDQFVQDCTKSQSGLNIFVLFKAKVCFFIFVFLCVCFYTVWRATLSGRNSRLVDSRLWAIYSTAVLDGVFQWQQHRLYIKM